MNATPLVSVVTPFHNTGRYLEECIRSVLAQTYPNFEYILVDNQSTDDSRVIAERYAAQDPRIRVHATVRLLEQDLNYSEALRSISDDSRYVKIVQADDFLSPRCLEEMVAVAEAHPSAGLIGSYYLKGIKVMGVGLPYPSPLVPGRTLCRLQLLEDYFFFGSPTVLLMRAEAVRAVHPFYEAGRMHADTEACYRTLRTWDFGFVHQILSHLRVDETSRMGSVRDFSPSSLDKFIVVTRYGRDYLDAGEFADEYRKEHHRYFRVLAGGVLKGKPREFWDYHRSGLATIGYRIRRWELATHVVLALVDWALNPKATVKRIVRFWRRLRERR